MAPKIQVLHKREYPISLVEIFMPPPLTNPETA